MCNKHATTRVHKFTCSLFVLSLSINIIGHILLVLYQSHSFCMSCVEPSYRGKGLGKEVTRMMICYGTYRYFTMT